MFVFDTLLFEPIITIAETLHQMAITEMYDVEALQRERKENELLYELGERDEETYRRRKAQLREEIELAEEMQQKLLSGNVQVVQS